MKYKIKLDYSRDSLITEFSDATTKDRYRLTKEVQNEDGTITEVKETQQELYARCSSAYADNAEHAQRIYDYASKMWFMPATPILANGGTNRGLPISCFVNEMQDSLDSIAQTWNENVYLAATGGGIGTHVGNIRSINEKITQKGQTTGVIPFIKVTDSMTLAVSQGALRRGSAAVYIQDTHPEIEEFVDIRRPTGDTNRRCLNIHHGVCISDAFMNAVQEGKPWNLVSPSSGNVVSTINARDLWIKILASRVETGEPYILFTDNVNKNKSKVYTELEEKYGQKVKTSNLCVAPETLILTPNGWQEIQDCANKETTIWNGFEWSNVTPRKTGENQKIFKVQLRPSIYNDKTEQGFPFPSDRTEIWATKHHKWYIKPKGIFAKFKKPICKRTQELKEGDEIINYYIPNKFTGKKFKATQMKVMCAFDGVHTESRISDTYCFTEPKRGMGVFNGILTGNCSEIHLLTGFDHLQKERTAVCCLSSLNLEYFDEWKNNELFIEDIARFLDNVLQDFIDRAPSSMEKARYSAMRERSIGIGVMGFHSFLQGKKVPFESVAAKSWNKAIFKHIREKCDIANEKLANEKGACPDALELGIKSRFANLQAVAPTASISNICGQSSPGIEPYAANSYTQKTLSGSFIVRNKSLKKLLQEKGYDTDEVWRSISLSEGSIQHLDFLTPEEKAVFKTAMEINQMWIIEHAADRQPFIDQGQSVNLFFAGNVEKTTLHKIHFDAWKKGVKGLYYCRSSSIQRAEKSEDKFSKEQNTKNEVINTQEYDECQACQ